MARLFNHDGIFLIVGFTTMHDPRHIDRLGGVIHSIDDAIVAGTNSPQIPRAAQLFAAGRPGIIGKLTNLWLDALGRVRGEAINSRFAEAAKVTL
jgi:hypothetical protein